MPEVRLIDANALMKRVCEKECGPHFNIDLCDLDDDSTDTRCVFREYVRSEPTVEAEHVRHGRWIEHGGGFVVTCSNCNATYRKDVLQSLSPYAEHLTRHCPNCGTKMDATDTNVGGKGGMTNADRIRQMTDEELADFFCKISQCCVNDASCSMCPIYDGCAQNVMCVERWLKQEVSEDAGTD